MTDHITSSPHDPESWECRCGNTDERDGFRELDDPTLKACNTCGITIRTSDRAIITGMVLALVAILVLAWVPISAQAQGFDDSFTGTTHSALYNPEKAFNEMLRGIETESRLREVERTKAEAWKPYGTGIAGERSLGSYPPSLGSAAPRPSDTPALDRWLKR